MQVTHRAQRVYRPRALLNNGDEGVWLSDQDIEHIWTAALCTIDAHPDLTPEMQSVLAKCRALLNRPLPDGQQEYGTHASQ